MSCLVSVIIPVYNVERYLRECIDSVLAQSYQNFEVLLVDDGSKDSSGRICDEYAEIDGRIQVIHQENSGLSVARNTGLNCSKGKYIYFLDSDDWILPETLSELVNTAEVEETDVVFFDARSFIDEDEKKEIEQRYIRKNKYQTENGYQVLAKLQNNGEYHSSVPLLFLKKNFIVNNKLSFFPNVLYEDILFTYQVYCTARRVAYLPKAFYQRRYRNESIMTSKRTIRNYRSASKIYLEVKEFTERIEKINDIVSQEYIARCAFNVLNIYGKINKSEQKECKEDYQLIKNDILNHCAYGKKALYMRCYGVFPWVCYKVYEKIVIRMRGK